jgi:hypothetical protein
VSHNSTQQRSKASNTGHLMLPRGINMFKEDAGGRAALDILPYCVTDARHPDRDEERDIAVEGSLWYRRPYKLHRSIGVRNVAVVCPTSIGKRCPICDYREKLVKEDKRDWKDPVVSSLRPSDRNLYYVVPQGDGKYEKKPHLWDISQFCFQDMLNDEFGEDEAFEDFPDLENGLTLRIRFSDEKIERTSFAKASRIDFEPRKYAYDEKLIGGLTSLDEVIDVKDYREVERLFFATEDVEEDVEDSHPPRGGVREPSGSITRPKSDAPTVLRRRSGSTATEPEQPDPELDQDGAAGGPGPLAHDRRPASPAPMEPSPAATAATTRRPASGDPSRAAPARSRGGDAGECPSGYVFGVDVDTKDECDKCPVWNECMDEKDALAAAAQ